MDIAQKKRKENIAEYILYLWQLEDLLRAVQFSPEAIHSALIKPRELKVEAHEQHPVLSLAGSDPGGKLRCLVGVAALDKIAQIADHLPA